MFMLAIDPRGYDKQTDYVKSIDEWLFELACVFCSPSKRRVLAIHTNVIKYQSTKRAPSALDHLYGPLRRLVQTLLWQAKHVVR